MEKNFLSINFLSSNKNYYFYSEKQDIYKDDYVLVETVIGLELGKVKQDHVKINQEEFALEIKPIISKASKEDLITAQNNQKLADEASNLFKKTVNDLKLDMRFISSQYTFDCSKILFTYASEERIDFRELLKILASSLHCRIELRQINSRERAQNIGGIGVCGLQLCCKTFFQTFNGISLNRAKNQMLAINIPKISGQCSKLMCCLKYEDDLYTEERKKFPKLGSLVIYNNSEYKLTSYNILTKVCKIESENEINFVLLNELKVK